jgi:hypothetical protein
VKVRIGKINFESQKINYLAKMSENPNKNETMEPKIHPKQRKTTNQMLSWRKITPLFSEK